MTFQRLSFVEAVETLASRFQVRLEYAEEKDFHQSKSKTEEPEQTAFARKGMGHTLT